MLINICQPIPNGVTTFLKAPLHANIVISELQLIIKLPSIVEMPMYADDIMLTQEQRDAIFWKEANLAQNKKVVTHFFNGVSNIRLLEFIIFRREPYYVENLLQRFTGLNDQVLQAGRGLTLSIEATNSGLLGASDLLTVWGQAEVVGI